MCASARGLGALLPEKRWEKMRCRTGIYARPHGNKSEKLCGRLRIFGG
jgi:hypothetical protein